MKVFYLFCLMIVFVLSFFLSYGKASRFMSRPFSLPFYHGASGTLMSAGSGLVCYVLLFLFGVDPKEIWIIFSAAAGGFFIWHFTTPGWRAQKWVEKVLRYFLLMAAFSAVFMTIAIVFTLFFETIRFFSIISPAEFLAGTQWNPQTTYGDASRAEDYGLYGAVPLFAGTLLIMSIAIVMAVPVALFIAIYTREYAKAGTRNMIKPVIEILAGIPTIVYGFFALVAVMPLLQSLGEWIGVEISAQSALGVGIVMGLMIIPYISSLSDDALGAVPQALRDNSLALGATPSETIKKVVIPAALPGIVSAILLAVSRAIGETMLVVMAAGLTAHLTFNPLKSVTTVTVQIVSLLTGDQEFNSPKTLSAFALGMTLFLMTFALNAVSLSIVRRYREKHHDA